MKSRKVPCEEIPIFCALTISDAVRKGGFDPDHQGPPRAGKFLGLGLKWSEYEVDFDDPRFHRVPTMREAHAMIPTGAWPMIGDPDGTSGKRELASAENGQGVSSAG